MGIRLRYNSPVVLTFTLIAAVVLLVDTFTARAASQALFTVYPNLDLRAPATYFRLFSHVIGHADWTHLMSNFSFILLIGPILEEKYGSGRILAMILVTALVTGLLAALVFRTALQGASGIVFMLILLGSFTNSREGEVPLTFILVVVLFLTQEVVNGLAKSDNIAQFAHIAGGICGALFGFVATRSTRRPSQGVRGTSAAGQVGASAAGPGAVSFPGAGAPEGTGRPGDGASNAGSPPGSGARKP